MRKTKFLTKAVVPILTVCTAAAVPFVSLGSETTATQDDWDRRFSTIQSMAGAISSTEKAPQQTNQVLSAPETVTVRPGNTMAGSIIYRDQNGNILDVVDPSKASEYEKLYRKTSTSSSGSMSTTSKTSSSSTSSSTTSSSSSKSSVYEKGGPGSSNVTDKTDNSQNFNGPTVEDVSLSETYYEDYDIYALSIQDQYFLYSTIGNNGITDKTVTVDIPANITFKATKDGMPMDYTSKQPLSETGTYVFRITVIQNPEDSVSRQNIIRTNYHFRIQPKVAKPKEETTTSDSTQTGSLYQDSYSNGYQSSYDSYAPENYLGNLSQNQNSSAQTQGQSQADSQTNSQSDSQYPSWDSLGDLGYDSFDNLYGTSSLDNTGDGTNSDLSGSESSGGFSLSMDGEDTTETSAEGSGEKPVYNRDLGMYAVLSDGNGTLYATVPNGMLTNYSVEVNTEQISGTVTLLKDGEEVELPESGTVKDPGSYEILLSGNGKKEMYSFRILGDAVNDLDYYTLPEDVTLTELYFDEKPLSSRSYTDSNGVQRIHFEEDGTYRMVMENELGAEFNVEVTCDRKPPVVQVTEGRGKADISYGDKSEIERVVLHSRKTEETLAPISQITKPGVYTMDVYDHAGNCTTVSFRVRSSMNTAAIVSVVLLLAIIGAFVFLFIRTKKDAKVS